MALIHILGPDGITESEIPNAVKVLCRVAKLETSFARLMIDALVEMKLWSFTIPCNSLKEANLFGQALIKVHLMVRIEEPSGSFITPTTRSIRRGKYIQKPSKRIKVTSKTARRIKNISQPARHIDGTMVAKALGAESISYSDLTEAQARAFRRHKHP